MEKDKTMSTRLSDGQSLNRLTINGQSSNSRIVNRILSNRLIRTVGLLWHRWLLVRWLFVGLFFFLLFLLSCIERNLVYLGMVRIFPDRSVHALPKLEYNFYGEDTYLLRESDDEGNFEGELPPDVYRILATNVDAPGVVFSEMDSFDLATVTMDNVNSQLSTVYSVVVEQLEVSDYGNILREPLPALLTKQLVFVFTLVDGLDTEVASITGELPGIYPSLRLSTGLPSPESVTQSLSTSVRFKVVEQGMQRSVQIGLFGLRDPENGLVYTSDLALACASSGGDEEETTIPLTSVLSEIISENGGVLPPLVYISVELKRTQPPTEVGITGSITAWKNGEEESIIIGERLNEIK
jgi:hypothetical protein